jgi:hypothetical protein
MGRKKLTIIDLTLPVTTVEEQQQLCELYPLHAKGRKICVDKVAAGWNRCEALAVLAPTNRQSTVICGL